MAWFQAALAAEGLRKPFFSSSQEALYLGDETAHGGADLLDGLEDPAMDDLFLEGPEEPLGDPVGLRFADEGVARGHAPEPDLFLEMLGMKLLP